MRGIVRVKKKKERKTSATSVNVVNNATDSKNNSFNHSIKEKEQKNEQGYKENSATNDTSSNYKSQLSTFDLSRIVGEISKPLSNQERNRIDRFINGQCHQYENRFQMGNVMITQRSFNSLKPCKMLTDEILNAYIHILRTRDKKISSERGTKPSFF